MTPEQRCWQVNVDLVGPNFFHTSLQRLKI